MAALRALIQGRVGRVRLIVASCCKIQERPQQPVWAEIQALAPDAVLLLGDQVYLERDDHHDPVALRQSLDALYQRQLAEPHFRALRADLAARGKPLLAIYDDHDFLGDNRCGGDVPPALRLAARAALCAALAPPQTGDEVYAELELDLLHLLILDVRFHRQDARQHGDDRDAILGAAQWQWLEQVIARSTAPYLALASSSTFHAFRGESWETYPAAFARLRDLLRGRCGALVLSGDIHNNAAYDDSGVIELVSSGVARLGSTHRAPRDNYAVLDFDAEGLSVQFIGRTHPQCLSFRLTRARWSLARG